MNADRTTVSVAELDPESRALLELSMVRGIPDGDLAGMLGSDPERLHARREAVLESLGVQSEAEREGLAATLRGDAPAPEPAEPEPLEPDEAIAPPDPPGDEPSPARGPRRVVWGVAGGLMIAAVVALALALAANDDEEPQPEAAAGGGRQIEPEPPPASGRPPAGLDSLGAGPGRASAQIVVGPRGPRLRLVVKGLPPVADGGYVVWLYNSVSEARELSGSRTGDFSVNPPLPPEADRYRFLDISREQADGNRNHSGATVLRIPIERIPRTSK